MSEIKKGDCFQLIKSLPDGSVDLILTDPPYGVTDLKFDDLGDGRLFDKLTRRFSDLFNEFHRVLKPNGWFFLFGSIELSAVVITQTSFCFWFEYVWEKHIQSGYRNFSKPLKRHEMIYAFVTESMRKPTDLTFNKEFLRTKGDPYFLRRAGRQETEWRVSHGFEDVVTDNPGYREGHSILNFASKCGMSHDERTDHPTQKPIGLAKKIIGGYTNRNDVVFDPFSGSGTFCVAAKEMNRRFLGYEIDETYYKQSLKRLSQSTTEMVFE